MTPGLIPVVARKSLLACEIERIERPAGQLLGQYIVDAIPDQRLYPYLHVWLGGRRIPREQWHLLRPKPGHELIVIPIPQGGEGGGAKVLRMALVIAVVAISIAVPAFAGPGSAIASGTIGGAVVSAGISLTGMMLVNALVPLPSPTMANNDAGSTSQHYSLEGATNQIMPYAPFPLMLGRRKMVPPLGAKPYTERVGDDEFLRLVVVWGYGPIAVTNIKIADTPIEDVPDVETEHCFDPATGDPDLTLYPRVIHEDRFGVELTNKASWITHATRGEVQAIQIEIAAPTGLRRTSENGKHVDGRDILIQYRYRIVGTQEWGDTIDYHLIGESVEPVFRRISIWRLPVAKYELQVRRATADVDPSDRIRIQDQTYWTLMQSWAHKDPIDAPGLARSAFRIKASSFANGAVQISGIVQTLARVWDKAAGIWHSQRATSNPAALYRHVIQHPQANSIQVFNAELDLPEIQDWYDDCEAKGFTCNGIMDWKGSLDEVLSRIAVTGRASSRRINGRYSVVRDRAGKTPTQLFTPRNVRNLTVTRQFVRLPHALHFRFDNEAGDWNQSEWTVYDDGRNSKNSTIIEDMEIWGVTSKALIQAHGRYFLAVGKLRPEIIEWDTDWEYLAALPGALVQLQHDVPLYGLGSGRVVARNFIAGECLSVMIDEQLVFDGSPHEVRIRAHDGSQRVLRLEEYTGETDQLVLFPALAEADAPQIGELCAVGKVGISTRSLVVRDVTNPAEEGAKLVCVDEASAVHDADDLIADFDPGIELPVPIVDGAAPKTAAPVIDNIRSDETAMALGPDGSVIPRILITLAAPYFTSTQLAGLVVDWRSVTLVDNKVQTGTWQYASFPPSARAVAIMPVHVGYTYEIIARYGFRDMGVERAGPWVGPVTHTVVGAVSAPPDVESMWQDGDYLRWSGDPVVDHAGWELRVSFFDDVPWEGAQPVSSVLITQEWFPVTALPAGAIACMIKAVDLSGMRSVNARIVAISPGTEPRYLPITEEDREAQGFPGDLAGGYRGFDTSGKPALLAYQTLLYGPSPIELYGTRDEELYGAEVFATMTYETFYQFPVTGLKRTDRLNVEADLTPGATVDVRWGARQVALPEADDPLWGDDPDPESSMFDTNVAYDLMWTVGESDTSRPWAGYRLQVPVVPGETMRLRVTCIGGAVQGLILRMTLILNALEESETIHNLAIPATGIRAKPTKPFRQLVWVHGMLLDPPGDQYMLRRTDKDPVGDSVSGPTMVAYHIGQGQVAGVADVTLGGF